MEEFALTEEEALREVGNRLMQGWTMLQDACPLSGFPLVEKDGVVWSVRCDMEVRTSASAGSSAQFADASAASPSSYTPPASAAASSTNEYMANAHLFSQRMSEKLLMGWQMIEEQCPVTNAVPLMLDSDGRRWSAATNDYVGAIAGQDDASAPPAPTSADAAATTAALVERFRAEAAESAAARERRQQTDAYSSRMGEKLLMGWRMLDRNCPVTNAVPLMQSPDGRLWSAATDEFIIEAGSGADVGVEEEEEEDIDATAASWETSSYMRDMPASFAEGASTAPAAASTAPAAASPQRRALSAYEREMPASFASSPAAAATATATASATRARDMDAMSSAIGQKLLAGWMMLEATCPVTGLVPLMRDLEGRDWSAATGGYVDEVAEEEVEPVAVQPAAVQPLQYGSLGGNDSPRRQQRQRQQQQMATQTATRTQTQTQTQTRDAPTPVRTTQTPRTREVSPQGATSSVGRSLDLALEATRAALDGHRRALELVAATASNSEDAFAQAERLVLALGNCAETITKISNAKAATQAQGPLH